MRNRIYIIFRHYKNSKSEFVELKIENTFLYEKNNFPEVSKNLARYKSENNFIGHQNNYVVISNTISNSTTNFDILVTSLSILHNYPTRLFLSLSPAECLDTPKQNVFVQIYVYLILTSI